MTAQGTFAGFGGRESPTPDPESHPPEGAESAREEGSRAEVRDYYRTVSRFIEMELARREDAGYWEARVQELGRPRVLELGAGTGRVTRVLAPHSRWLLAVDLSREMLARAREAVADFPHVHLVLGDIRRLAFAHRFDLVAAANDPFVHLPDDVGRDRALTGVSGHLTPGGRFILDAHWLPEDRRRQAMEPGGWRRERTLDPGPEAPRPEAECSVVEWWRLDSTGHRGRVEFEYREGGRVVGRATFRPRLWTAQELETRFPAAGLRVRRCLGGYDGTPWDPATAHRLIVESEAA